MLVLHEALQELALALTLPHALAGHSDSCKGHDAKPRKTCVASGDAVLAIATRDVDSKQHTTLSTISSALLLARQPSVLPGLLGIA